MNVKLYALSGDPDTNRAEKALTKARIGFQVIDVESTGILPFLDRDLGARTLPFIVTSNATFEGFESIRQFAERSA